MNNPIVISSKADPMIQGAIDFSRNALWNYVSAIVWLRWLRRCKVAFNVLPIVFGAIGSWRVLSEHSSASASLIAAGLALTAGIVPLIYLATGIDENIASTSRLAGRYRVLEARARDFVIRFSSMSSQLRDQIYHDMREELLHLKAEAHTFPRWAFKSAERLIDRGDYVPLSLPGQTDTKSVENL